MPNERYIFDNYGIYTIVAKHCYDIHKFNLSNFLLNNCTSVTENSKQMFLEKIFLFFKNLGLKLAVANTLLAVTLGYKK